MTRGEENIKWIETHCCIPEGKFVGRPVKLRPFQRKIVLGKGGQTIKALGQAARLELEKAFERRVHLFLFVKVREHWAKDPERLRAMGLLD